jgi:hydrogenase nickel incorporation protein HypA/HybF
MHELGIMYHVVERALGVAEENGVSEIEAIVLRVGELSGVIPKYLEACYGAAADGTLLESARLEIETVPAEGRCRSCGRVFDVPRNRRVCPRCGCGRYELLSGKELMIKEIRAR